MNEDATRTPRPPRRIWTVVPFTPADLPALGLYFKRHFRRASLYGSMGLFHWRSVENYVMPGMINLIKDGDKIVATLSNTPKRLLVRGEVAVVAEIGDANTDPAYQRQGMLSLLINQSTRDAMERGVRGVYSTPDFETPSLGAFITKANFKPQVGLDLHSLVLPLNIQPFAASLTNPLIGHYAGSVYLTFAAARRLVRNATLPRLGTATIEEAAAVPDDWDDFWNRCRTSYDLIFERNREALTWRFFTNPNKFTFYVLRDKGALAGYLVHGIVPDEDVKRLIIADFLVLPEHLRNFDWLLAKALADAFRLGVHLVSAWAIPGSPYDRSFRRFGFRPRKGIQLVWFQNEFAATLGNAGKWHFTISDSDNI